MRYLILILLLSSCIEVPQGEKTHRRVVETQSRIKMIEEMSYFSIVQVDSVEYLVNYHGGIVPLVKKY
jgi:hypothetical protein